ncbi:hypothetical protein Hanom_Chr15g01387691 [Helianthus anomalus]
MSNIRVCNLVIIYHRRRRGSELLMLAELLLDSFLLEFISFIFEFLNCLTLLLVILGNA